LKIYKAIRNEGVLKMIVLCCPNCDSTHIQRDDEKMEKRKISSDWFICEYCKHSFLLKYTGYRTERNFFES